MNNAISRRRLLGREIYKQTAYGNPILIRSMARMRPPLTIYGHSTQDGTPSPENPVPIVSAGSVMTTGAQLLDYKKIQQENDYCTVEFIENGVQLDGKWYAALNSIPVTPDTDYCISYIGSGTKRVTICVRGDRSNTIISMNPSNPLVFNTGENNNIDILFYSSIDETPSTATYTNIMLNAGSTALPWEPYTGGVPGVNPYAGEINISVSDGGTQSQTLTLSTPGGLPGIPVTSGGNYTDENGQQWICDEIDFKRGKYVQRVKCARLSGNIYDTEISLDRYIIDVFNIFGSIPTVKYPVITSVASTIEPITQSIQNQIFQYANGIYWYCTDYFSSKEELQTFLEENDVTIIGYLAEPIETDLPAEEIAAYKALHTYSPTTTVSNDAGAWMKVGYKTKKSLQLV